MKNVVQSFIHHKDLYTLSISFGALVSAMLEIFIHINERTLFGVSFALWVIALGINIIDIHTGIKADTVRRKNNDEKFVFESKKGWRAFEKISIFTLIVWFIYTMEKEVFRLDYPEFLGTILMTIKFILLFYVVFIELQSIGENEEVRFGKKSKMFLLLDQVIEVVNEGILNKLKNLIK